MRVIYFTLLLLALVPVSLFGGSVSELYYFAGSSNPVCGKGRESERVDLIWAAKLKYLDENEQVNVDGWIVLKKKNGRMEFYPLVVERSGDLEKPLVPRLFVRERIKESISSLGCREVTKY